MVDWLKILEDCAQNMQKEILKVHQTAEAGKQFGRGAGGDIQKEIDLVAETALSETLRTHKASCTLISEESGTKKIGAEQAKYILVPEQGEANAHIVPSSMQKARTTLVQPLVMADRPSFTVFMTISR